MTSSCHVPGIYRETALLQLMDLTESAGIPDTLKVGQHVTGTEEPLGQEQGAR
jgi:hypothetical protein